MPPSFYGSIFSRYTTPVCKFIPGRFASSAILRVAGFDIYAYFYAVKRWVASAFFLN